MRKKGLRRMDKSALVAIGYRFRPEPDGGFSVLDPKGEWRGYSNSLEGAWDMMLSDLQRERSLCAFAIRAASDDKHIGFIVREEITRYMDERQGDLR